MFAAKLSGFPFIGNFLDLCQFKMHVQIGNLTIKGNVVSCQQKMHV